MLDITVRRMAFEFPDDLDTVFIEGEPEDSYTHIALSLLMPYIEPYLIRTMKAAREHVTDPRLARDLSAFILQEGQHFQQHRRFNAIFRDRGFDRLPELEADVAADYERFSAEMPLAFNLAYAEGFEALTTAMGIFFLESDHSAWHPRALDLFTWHLVEELEHRTVAFEVFQHLVGDYTKRLRWGAFAQRHLIDFTTRVARYMVDASPEVIERHGGIRAHRARVRRLSWRMLVHVLPRLLRTHAPWYTPHDLRLPQGIEALAQRYTEQASHVVRASR